MIDICKQPHQDLGLCVFSFMLDLEKSFTQIYRDAMLVPFQGAPTWQL